MIDVSLFGALLWTLGSWLAVVLLLMALASASLLAAIGLVAARRLQGELRTPGGGAPFERGARVAGLAVGLGALLLLLLGLRIGAGASEAAPTIAVSVAAAAALGTVTACAWVFGGHGLAALRAAREQREASARFAEGERLRALEASRRAFNEGEDVRAEVTRSEAALARLRAALAGLQRTRAALEERLMAAATDPTLTGEATRARDEVAAKAELGQRVLDAAEAAVFRLACNAPLRLLLRRRPREAMVTLSAGAPDQSTLEAVSEALGEFLEAVSAARVELDEIDARRPASQLPGDGDPLGRARRDLDALEAAYGGLLERLSLAWLRLSARADAAAVEAAAGALPGAAAATASAPAEILALITEITRAEAVVAEVAPESSSGHAVMEALAAGSAALDRSDAASLGDLIAALREVR